jgi:hypothetical protein
MKQNTVALYWNGALQFWTGLLFNFLWASMSHKWGWNFLHFPEKKSRYICVYTCSEEKNVTKIVNLSRNKNKCSLFWPQIFPYILITMQKVMPVHHVVVYFTAYVHTYEKFKMCKHGCFQNYIQKKAPSFQIGGSLKICLQTYVQAI